MNPAVAVRTDDAIVVGSGIAGLVSALSLAPKSVTLLTKTSQLAGGSSLWAQGGIAAAVGPGDSPEAHAADTLSAGAGLSDPERTRTLTEEGAASLQWLVDEGIPFDRDLDGALALAQEAAHRFPRIAHAGGDTTGYVLMNSLIGRVTETPSIDVIDDTFVYDLLAHNGRVSGLLTFSAKAGWVVHRAPIVILATGGAGMIWWQTTNPVEATGDGLAMAARAGARLADLEFVQFHPTALAVEPQTAGASLPLLTEALRGAGAVLLDELGQRFMVAEHPAAELAPRDVVARAIQQRTVSGQQVYLDLRPVLSGKHKDAFPKAVETARRAGFDPNTEALPVAPAAHYHMGGIEVDAHGRTSLAGLWACGEVATTGIHGANRLASNSLLEALVFARRAAADSAGYREPFVATHAGAPGIPRIPAASSMPRCHAIVAATRDIMTRHVGILRSGDGLQAAYEQLNELEQNLKQLEAESSPASRTGPETLSTWGEARNIVLIARLVTFAALRRTESRGAHFRCDFPTARPEWRHPQSLTVAKLAEVQP
jgi:L-aspartate oxidase